MLGIRVPNATDIVSAANRLPDANDVVLAKAASDACVISVKDSPELRLTSLATRLDAVAQHFGIEDVAVAYRPFKDGDTRFEMSDQYFRVERTSSESPLRTLLAATVLTVRRIIPFAEVPQSSITSLERAALLMAPYAAAALVGGAAIRTASKVEIRNSHEYKHDRLDDDARWVYGHHLFIVIDQLLVLGLTRLRDALESENWDRAAQNFRLLGDLFAASSVAMKITGDMPPEVYQNRIRTAMAQHNAAMSGINMDDHGTMVKFIRQLDLRLASARFPDIVEAAHRYFVVQRVAASDSHVYVCEHAVGSKLPSMKAEASGASVKSAAELTRDFAEQRRKQVGCPFTHKFDRNNVEPA